MEMNGNLVYSGRVDRLFLKRAMEKACQNPHDAFFAKRYVSIASKVHGDNVAKKISRTLLKVPADSKLTEVILETIQATGINNPQGQQKIIRNFTRFQKGPRFDRKSAYVSGLTQEILNQLPEKPKRGTVCPSISKQTARYP